MNVKTETQYRKQIYKTNTEKIYERKALVL